MARKIPWDDIHSDYDEKTDEPVKELCARYGITTRMLYDKIEREGWTRRGRSEDRPSADMVQIAEVKRLVRNRVDSLKRAEKTGSVPADAVSQLVALVRLLERIDVLEEKRRAAARRSPKLMNDARRFELARRLENLRRQLEMDGEPVQPEVPERTEATAAAG